MSKTSIEWLPTLRQADCRMGGDAMGTRYSARFLAPEQAQVKSIAAALEAAVGRVDRQMSNWKPDSDLSRLNGAAVGAWTPIPSLAGVLVRAIEIGRESNNAFNIGVGELVEGWGFGPAGSFPKQNAAPVMAPHAPLDTVLEIDLPGCRARRHAPVTLDLCGIAKGFGVDELGRALDTHRIGLWLVGIDGEMRSRGTRPDGLPWAIALELPQEDRRAAMGVIELGDAAVATSGDYRHFREVDGGRISHAMDPRLGAPLRNSVASVTVIAPRCMDADAYATALMVLGKQEGTEFARRLGLDALFVVRDGGMLRTVGTGAFGAT
jgi:thiamine biosynthesis lipoprotein